MRSDTRYTLNCMGAGFGIGFVATFIGAALDLRRPEAVFMGWGEFLNNWPTALMVAVGAAFVGGLVAAVSQRVTGKGL